MFVSTHLPTPTSSNRFNPATPRFLSSIADDTYFFADQPRAQKSRRSWHPRSCQGEREPGQGAYAYVEGTFVLSCVRSGVKARLLLHLRRRGGFLVLRYAKLQELMLWLGPHSVRSAKRKLWRRTRRRRRCMLRRMIRRCGRRRSAGLMIRLLEVGLDLGLGVG